MRLLNNRSRAGLMRCGAGYLQILPMLANRWKTPSHFPKLLAACSNHAGGTAA